MACPSLRAGGSWIDSRALGGGGPRIVALTMGDSKPGANIFPPFPGERPTSEDILKWLKEATPLLTADESALAGGLVPRSLLTYSPGIVPVPLVVATGITETTVTAREALIFDRVDANQTKQLQHDTHLSEIENNWFKKFQAAFRTSAPLLLASMERDCSQAAPFAVFHSGVMTWKHVKTLGEPAAMMPGENEMHDAYMYMIALTLKPLGSSATPQEFAQRVGTAMKDHVFFLTRPFADKASISQWVVKVVRPYSVMLCSGSSRRSG